MHTCRYIGGSWRALQRGWSDTWLEPTLSSVEIKRMQCVLSLVCTSPIIVQCSKGEYLLKALYRLLWLAHVHDINESTKHNSGDSDISSCETPKLLHDTQVDPRSSLSSANR